MFKNKDETLSEAGQVIKQFEAVRAYKRAMQFEANWTTYVNFIEDRQWERTDKNKNMPKPQHNILKFAKKQKTSAILSDNIKMLFSPVEVVEEGDIAQEASDMFNKAGEATIEEVEQDRLDYEVVNDAFTLGTGWVHYFWDNGFKGGYKTKYIGTMRGEVLDSMNVFPGNPQQKDKDKQPFIIITYRDMAANVKKEAKDNGISQLQIENITADKDTVQEVYEASRYEVNGEDKTTVYVKYWRDTEDNKIYFMKCTKGVVIKPKTAVWEGYSGTDTEPYPLAYFNWDDRKKSIFGIGEVEGMLYNQKAINFIDAMRILTVQDTGWPKTIVKYDALQQKIQNVPGEVIYDKSGQQGDNIKPMQTPTMSPQVAQVLEDIINNTRIFNGVSETVTGETIGSVTAASAIIALQNQAKVPLDAVRKKFYRYRKEVGQIWEFFFKCKYNLPRQMASTDEQGNKTPFEFLGTAYKDIPLNLKITVGAGSTYSESLATATLDKFLDKQYITPMQYAQLASDNVMPFKETFIKMKEEEQQQQLALQQEQEQGQLAQATQALQKQNQVIQALKAKLGGGQVGPMSQMPSSPQG